MSASVRSNMNTSIDPCVDFYQYSCGGWNTRNQLTTGALTRFAQLAGNNTAKLRAVIESDRDGDVRAVQLARQFYNSCLDNGLLDAMGSQPLVQLARSMGGWSLINSKYTRYECIILR